MMKSKLRGGKTPPRLIRDLLLYDPKHKARSGYNVLTDIPEWVANTFKVSPEQARGSCNHEWSLDEDHSSLPESGHLPTSLSVFCVVAHCSVCHSHLAVVLDYRFIADGGHFLPCPNPEAPLHHFVHKPAESEDLPNLQPGATPVLWFDLQIFQCSSQTCAAKLSVTFRPARLPEAWIDLMIDKNALTARAQKAIEQDPERFEGHAAPSATDVLTNLRTYLQNGMQNDQPRKILGQNKKWLLCFGEDCADMLRHIGFTREGKDWFPPSPGPSSDLPSQETLYNSLNQIEKELLMLLMKRPSEERRAAKLQESLENPTKSLRAMLGTLDYKVDERSLVIPPEQPEHPFYAGLGIIRKCHDSLIIFAYERQIAIDWENTGYYLECIEGIAEGRSSSDLETKAVMEQTSDKVSKRDVRMAYKELGIPINDNIDDDTILGTFQARLSDAGKHQEEGLRRALKVIGADRASAKIQNAASMSVTTYEQALTFLNATDDISDDAVPAVFTAKVADNKADEDRARQAVLLIAEHRKSSALKAWLDTGEMGLVEMDIGHAYNRLEISDRMIDDETILAAYNAYVAETPSQLSDLKNALTAIARSRNSTLLLSFLGTAQVMEEHKLSEWPVGLENIGNTCYLNSLLQSYFTVKPLRDLVLKFDDYRMPIDVSALAVKQVGSRQVSRKEIERAQRFVMELRKLFNSMITAPRAQVTPEQELARLTLISSTNEEKIRRRSTIRGQRPSLGEINGRPVLGPTLPSPPSTKTTDPHDEMTETPVSTAADKSNHEAAADDSSEGTLVEKLIDFSDSTSGRRDSIMSGVEDTSVKQQQNILDDKENLPPSKEPSAQSPSTSETLDLLGPASPSRMNALARPLSPIKELESSVGSSEKPAGLAPPTRAPPVPPRPELEPKESIQEQLELGAQQDLTEVIGNVLFQLQCAIKAERIDAQGEQIDLVKRLFYGKLKSNTINLKGETRTNEEFFSDIKVNVSSEPSDMYAALDGAFDLQDVDAEGVIQQQYTTISLLPPILQIHIQRGQFDKDKQTASKSNHHIEMKPTIYMDRYRDSTNPKLISRRKKCWRWKKELAELKNEKSIKELLMSESLSMLGKLLKQINAPDDADPIQFSPELPGLLEREAELCKKRVEDIEAKKKDLEACINSQFADLRDVRYHLHSVFIHRGGTSSGHYWVYIYDFKQDRWRKYNDGYVTDVTNDEEEVYGKDTLESRPATPYFLVYVKDELEEQLADAICRDPEEPPPYSQDTVMQDVVASVELEHAEQENAGGPSSGFPGVIGGWDAKGAEHLNTKW